MHVREHLSVVDAVGVLVGDIAILLIADDGRPAVLSKNVCGARDEHSQRLVARWISPCRHQNALRVLGGQVVKAFGQSQVGNATRQGDGAFLEIQ